MSLLEWHKALGRVCNGDDDAEFDRAIDVLKPIRSNAQLFFIGNGGSAAIASHMAVDYLNKGRFNARCLNDPAALTCLSNDYGYEHVFGIQLGLALQPNDVLVAISSSGVSKNITNAASAARDMMATVITLTGFEPDNPLRQIGHINFHVPSTNYGIVETAHLGLLHALLEAVTS